MPRYAVFLRGVSPMNCKMPELVRALETVGFTRVVTVLSSGNAVFDAKPTALAALEAKIEAATGEQLGRVFSSIVRPVSTLVALIEADPFAEHAPKATEKRVVSFFKRQPTERVTLPVAMSKARIVAMTDTEAFSLYEREDTGPVFMSLIEKTFGKELTTRTWETVLKVTRK